MFAEGQNRAAAAALGVTHADPGIGLRHLDTARTVTACFARAPHSTTEVRSNHLPGTSVAATFLPKSSNNVLFKGASSVTMAEHKGGHMEGEPAVQSVDERRRRRTVQRVVLAVSALLATAAFIVGTPFLLLAISHLQHNDWTQFSNEGQSYGGIAAIFGMLALVGVAASLILQSRQTTASRELTQRTIHADLLSRALNDPELLACWGPSLHGDDIFDRQHFYTNLIVAFWRSMFEIGKVTEDELHALSAQMFAGAPGQRYWTIAGPYQRSHYCVTERDRKFIEILDEEHATATVGEPVAESSKHQPLLPTSTGGRSTIGALIFGLAGGALLSRAVAAARRRYNRPL